MRVDRLQLRDFRNHRDTDVTFGPGVNVITGPNGAGKTSLLEAVHLLATNSSFRIRDDRGMIRDGCDAAVVRGTVVTDGRSVELAIGLGQVSHRFVRNGTPQRRADDVVGTIRCVVFAPDDLDLVKGSPSRRRDYLDTGTVAVRPAARTTLQEWERVLRQRNSLLKSLRHHRGPLPSMFTTWTELAVTHGAAVAASRCSFVRLLDPHFRATVHEFGIDPPSIAYTGTWFDETAVPAGTDAEALADWFAQRLDEAFESVRGRELERGATAAGPHLDDLVIGLGDRDARTRASQGEQRTLSLGLRLGQLGVMTEETGQAPILLLDDVFSELDPFRRGVLLRQLPATQTLITTTADPAEPGVAADLLRVVAERDGRAPVFVAVAADGDVRHDEAARPGPGAS